VIRTRVFDFTAAGSTVSGTIGVPPGRYAGAYYNFTPDRGTGDITISNLGRVLLSKSNALNADGVQELAPAAEKIVSGQLAVTVNEVQAGDRVHVTVFTNI
jgi:hypothetical protein